MWYCLDVEQDSIASAHSALLGRASMAAIDLEIEKERQHVDND